MYKARLRALEGRYTNSKSPVMFHDKDEGRELLGGTEENSVFPKEIHRFTLLANQYFWLPNLCLLAPSLDTYEI